MKRSFTGAAMIALLGVVAAVCLASTAAATGQPPDLAKLANNDVNAPALTAGARPLSKELSHIRASPIGGADTVSYKRSVTDQG